MEDLEELAKQLGCHDAQLIRVKNIITARWVALKCKYGCPYFSNCLVCPPFSPSFDEMAMILRDYTEALLFRADSSWLVRYLATELEKSFLNRGFVKAFGLGSGPCKLCEPCDVSRPCQHPMQARPSMEAAGIDVFSTVRSCGWEGKFVAEKDKPRDFFGLVLLW
jgi:predicted metal-binding protein